MLIRFCRATKLLGPSSQSFPVVHRCWDAYERFVSLGAISLGLLQLLALKFTDSVWSQFGAFLRTRSRMLPSERTVKSVIAGLLLKDFNSFAPHAILRGILGRFAREKRPPVKTSSSIGPNVHSALG